MSPLKKPSAVHVRPGDGDEPAPVEIIERAIIDLATGMRRLNDSRLKHETVVLLLSEASGIGKPAVRSVLRSLLTLEEQYLKPRPAGATGGNAGRTLG